MPIIEKPDRPARRHTPDIVKLILLVAVLFGIYMRSCWDKKRNIYYEVTAVELSDQTISSVDVLFVVKNNTKFQREENFIVKLYSDRGDMIASKIVSVDLEPNSQKRYRKTVDSWQRALYDDEELSHATVENYKAKIL
jgi:hypothetical protein